MSQQLDEITINGTKYVQAETATKMNNENYVIVRTYSAGVFAGFLKSRNGQEVILSNARRLWSWDGAASLSQLAMEGTCRPENCKFPCEVTEIILTQSIEIIPCSEKAVKSLRSVKIWKA